MAPSEGLGRFGEMTEGERRLERVEHSLLCCLLFSFVLSSGNKLLLESAWEVKKWIESAMARRKREKGWGGGVIGHARQYILPSRPTLHPSSPPTSPPSLTTLICFPLCLIRTRWIRLSSPASLLLNLPPSSRPPFSSLSPPGFARLWHPTDFVTLWFLARREKYQAESRFQQAKNEGLTEWELWEHKKAFLCLLQLLSLYFPYLVCLLASYFHSCWFFGVNAGFLL